MKKQIKISENLKKVRPNIYYILGSIAIIVLIILLAYTLKGHNKQALVKNGIVENTEITTGFVIKNEKQIEKNSSKVLVPIISEGSKVAKKSIIATYKSGEYEDYEETLAKLDSEILTAMKDLPPVYSSEIDAIDDIIYSLVKESMGEKSYNKMQEYKQRINTNINKRAVIVGKLSPDGAEIKSLINKRNKYEQEAQKSNDNILAPITGLVSYKVDGLEDKLKSSKIEDYTYDKIKNIVKESSNKNSNGIKVVNNYEAYIVIKSNKKYLEHMAEGSTYRIRFIEDNNYEFRASLYKIVENKNDVEVYFKITNGIEELVNIREAELEIVWQWEEGLYIPIKALNKYESKDVYYVTCTKYAEEVNIPIKINTKNDSFAVIENYTTEELENLKLATVYELKLHDRIITN